MSLIECVGEQARVRAKDKVSMYLTYPLVDRWYPGTITTKIGEEFHFVKHDNGDQQVYCMHLHNFYSDPSDSLGPTHLCLAKYGKQSQTYDMFLI